MPGNYTRVTVIWVCGLIIIFTLALFWLGSLGLAIFKTSRAHGADEVGDYVVSFALVLVALGATLIWFVNRFYDWHRDQQLSSLLKQIDERVEAQARIDKLMLDFSSELSETFKSQLRSSATFQTTVIEAQKLVEEFEAFSAISHTNEERGTFRKAWQAKTENFVLQSL